MALHHICVLSRQLLTIFRGVIQEELVYDHVILKANTSSICWGWRGCKVGAALHFDLRQHQLGSVD